MAANQEVSASMNRNRIPFKERELEVLNRIYQQLISNQTEAKSLAVRKSEIEVVKKGIDRTLLCELLHSTFDIVTEELLMERIFANWDVEGDGITLRSDGWLRGLYVILRGTLNEKARFCFRVYDLNGDGFISKEEMYTLLRQSLIKQPQDDEPDEAVKDLVEIVLKKLDVDKDGKISLNDFVATVCEKPLLLEAFGQCLPTDGVIDSFLSAL